MEGLVFTVGEGGVGQAHGFEEWVQRGEVSRLRVWKWMRVRKEGRGTN